MLTPTSIETVRNELRGVPGLVAGPAVGMLTTPDAVLRDLRNLAIESCELQLVRSKLEDPNLDLWHLIDLLASAGGEQNYTAFRLKVERYFRESKSGHQTQKISKTPWSAIISLCFDGHIEEAIRQHIQSKPGSRRVTVLSSPLVLGRPAANLPVFKLLGNCNEIDDESRIALSKSEYLLRKGDWGQLLNPLADYLRDGGLIFLGVDRCEEQVQDLLSTLFSGNPPFPNYLVFSERDSVAGNPIVERLVRGRCPIFVVSGDYGEILDSLILPRQNQLQLRFDTSGKTEMREYQKFKSLVDIVPSKRPSYKLQTHRQEALEGLFRPNGVLWDAFLFDLDLPRDIAASLSQTMLQLQAGPTKRPKVVVLRGEAGVGKTVIAKHVAVRLQREGHVVFWCKKTHGEFFQLYREFARELRSQQAKQSSEVGYFMFWDDPWSLGLAPIEFAAALDGEGVDITIAIVARNSDKAVARGFARLPPVDAEIEIPAELSVDEEAALPDFLHKVGAVANVSDARRILAGLEGRNARDILCRLWYLLPDTRDQIERSLSDEYFRLEHVDKLIGSIVDQPGNGTTARRAYEAVAVTSGLGFGVPTEVLVNSLKINYSEWVSMCAGGRPLWGLLYPVEMGDEDQYWYFTRNDVVTQILLRQINGGIGHAADVRVLRGLVEACSGSSPVYRDFLVELLVKNKDRLKKIVLPNEGRELYEIAIRTFPTHDRTLVHHYGKWLTDVVGDHEAAYEVLNRALATGDYVYASHEERREFIHTSMAAVILRRVKKGEQDRESGLLAIKRHLREASSPTFFNLYTVHVQVNALYSLQEGDDPVSMDCFIEACRAIERAQQLAGASGRRQIRFAEALDMLEAQKRQLADSMMPFERLQADALERFEATGDQLPLEAAALKGLIEASMVDKGSAYNEVHQFLIKCQSKVSSRRQQLAPGLRQVRIDLMVRWRLQHSTGEVDWSSFLGDVSVLRDEPARRDDILLLFYEGIANFHLKRTTDAQAAFTRLRALQVPAPLMGNARVFYRSKSGQPAQLQGVLVRTPPQGRVRLPELGYEVPIGRERAPMGAQQGATVHCWVSFSLLGPTAEFSSPENISVLLPS